MASTKLSNMRTLSFDITVLADFQGYSMRERYKRMAEIQNVINEILQNHAGLTGSAQIHNARCPRVESNEG